MSLFDGFDEDFAFAPRKHRAIRIPLGKWQSEVIVASSGRAEPSTLSAILPVDSSASSDGDTASQSACGESDWRNLEGSVRRICYPLIANQTIMFWKFEHFHTAMLSTAPFDSPS